MKLLDAIKEWFGPPSFRATYAPWSDFWYQPTIPYGTSAAGVATDPESAMRTSAVFACVRLISRSVAQLPLVLYRWRQDGGKERAPTHPLYRTLHDAPTPQQTSFEWREFLTRSLLLRGNGYAEITYRPDGQIDQLIPIHPDRVTIRLGANGVVSYYVRPRFLGYDTALLMAQQDEAPRVLLAEQMFHLRDLSEDGVSGRSVIRFARESVGLAVGQETYAAKFFAQGVRPPIAIKHPGKLSPDAHNRMKQSWQESFGGIQGAHRPAILEEGSDIAVLGMTNTDAQWIEGRAFSVADLARWFGVPSHAINDLARATFSNIDQLQIFLVTHSLMPYLVLWEQAISRDLILDPETYFAEFLIDSLLRGDTLQRFQAYALAISNGIMSENEVRIRENLNPWPGLDEPTRSVNQGRGGGGGDGTTPANGVPANRELTPSGRQRAFRVVHAAAERAVKRETEAVQTAAKRHAADPVAWRQWVDEFYARHAAYLSEGLRIDLEAAQGYALDHRAALLAEGMVVLETWKHEAAAELYRLAMEEECHEAG